MDKLKYVKLENPDGSYSNSIPLAVDSDHVDVNGNTLTNELNNKANLESISNLSSKVDSLASGSPAGVYTTVAALTSADPDHNKIYVVTADGHWYYYNNGWQDGGLYQSRGLDLEEVSLSNLDDELQENFIGSYELIAPSTFTDGEYLKVVNNEIVEDTSSSWEWGYINLTPNDTYYITYKRFKAIAARTYIITENDVVIAYADRVSSTDDEYTFNNFIFKAKAQSKLYLCHRKNILDYQVYRLTDVNNNPQVNTFTLSPIATYENKDLTTGNSVIYTTLQNFGSATGYNIDVYRIEKGKKYTFENSSWYSIYGIVRTDLNNIVKYVPPIDHGSSAAESDPVVTNDTFTATEDGYVYTCTHTTSTRVYGRLSLYEEPLNYLHKWYAIGDSITANTSRCLHNYLYYIGQDIPTLEIINKGIAGTGYFHSDRPFYKRIDSINDYNSDTDIITVMGSVNDKGHINDDLGQLGDTTDDTIYGSMHLFFTTLFTKFNGVRVGIIEPINWKNSNTLTEFPLYLKALEDTAKLFNVPILKLYDETNLRPNNSTFLNTYYVADGLGNNGEIDTSGIHPNSAGHKLFYKRIEEFIKTL